MYMHVEVVYSSPEDINKRNLHTGNCKPLQPSIWNNVILLQIDRNN